MTFIVETIIQLCNLYYTYTLIILSHNEMKTMTFKGFLKVYYQFDLECLYIYTRPKVF
jgi:hypothetical protein